MINPLFAIFVPSVVILLRRSPTKGPLKESGKTRAHLPRGEIVLQALLSISFLPRAKSSAELDGITSKGNNENTAVRNISNERLNVINDNTSANSTKSK